MYIILADCHELLEFTEKLALEAGFSPPRPTHTLQTQACLSQVSSKAAFLGIQAQIMLGGAGFQAKNLFCLQGWPA